jgi:hypothetical protein
MRLFVAIGIFLASASSAFGNNECLQNSTNGELIRELDRRLSGSTGGSQSAAASFSCDSQTNLFRFSATPAGVLTDLSKRYIGSSSRCVEEQRRINTAP